MMLSGFSKRKDWLNRRGSRELAGNAYSVSSMVTVWSAPGFQAIVKYLLNRSRVKASLSKPGSSLKSSSSPPVFSSFIVSFMVDRYERLKYERRIERQNPIYPLWQMRPGSG